MVVGGGAWDGCGGVRWVVVECGVGVLVGVRVCGCVCMGVCSSLVCVHGWCVCFGVCVCWYACCIVVWSDSCCVCVLVSVFVCWLVCVLVCVLSVCVSACWRVCWSV